MFKLAVSFSSLVILGVVVAALAQTPNIFTPKPSPTVESLTKAAKQLVDDRTALQNAYNQARSTADASSKQLQEQLRVKSNELSEKLKADKKYAKDYNAILTMQQQLASLGSAQANKLQTEMGPIQQRIQSAQAQIDILVPLVRQENGFDPSTTFDPVTQTWKGK